MEGSVDLDTRAASLAVQLKQREELLTLLSEDGDGEAVGLGGGGEGAAELARLPAEQRVAAMEKKLADIDAKLSAMGSEADEVLVTPSGTPAAAPRPRPPVSEPAEPSASTWKDVGGWGASALPPRMQSNALSASSGPRPSWLSAPDLSKASKPSLPMPKGPPSIPAEALGRHASDIRITGTIEDPASGRPPSMQSPAQPPGGQPALRPGDAPAGGRRRSPAVPQLPSQSPPAPLPLPPPPPPTARDVLLATDGITAPWAGQGPAGMGAQEGREEAEEVAWRIGEALRRDVGGGGGEAEAAEALLAHASRRERQLRAARGALELAEGQRRRAVEEREAERERAGYAEKEVERLRGECDRLEERVGGEYARQDHIRAVQALQDTQEKLAAAQAAAARLEEEVRVRDESLAAASESLEALQESRSAIRDTSAQAHGALERAEAGMRDAIRTREEVEARLGRQVAVLEQELREAVGDLDLERHARGEAEAAAERLSRELEEAREARRRVETELREKIAVQAAQIEEQEEEIDELHARNMEMDELVGEQGDAMEEMIHNTLAEVARREQEWIRARARKDEKIEGFEAKDEGAKEEARRAEQAVAAYEQEFEKREAMRKEEVAALKKQMQETEEELRGVIAEKERDIKNRAAGASKRMAELERKDVVQAKQIEELMRQKAWLTKQLGISALDS